MAHTPIALVICLARTLTPRELCDEADKRDDIDGAKYLDALALHAKRSSWGDLIEQSINGWEVDVGLVQGG